MGADMKNLRTRIRSVDSTLHLTKAMGLVASSKIRRATEKAVASRRYADALLDAMAVLTADGEVAKSPYMQVRDTSRTRLIVIAGDRGLAGGYNANVFRLVRELGEAVYYPIGKRACERFGGEFASSEHVSYEQAHEWAEAMCRDFENEEFDRLGIVWTRFDSMMTQTATVDWVLPLTKAENAPARTVEFEPDAATVLTHAVCEYVAGLLTARLRESFASEVAARRMAMDSAGKNAQEMIDDLQLKYNRARQGAITQEITEIVAGSGME
ncbi:MAG: ATP synthase F1 subunit gamma [Clostridia bacterium]|nr:ATP synthase F1 subunit gamma [Clostridia bacterium]